MNLLLMNLQDLTHQYRNTGLAPKAVECLESGQSNRDLANLLRDHHWKPVYDEREIELRDAFDELLSFYSLIEIASLARFVPHPLPREFQTEALGHLESRSVVTYYQEYYPLLLPQLLRLRLQDKHDLHVESTNATVGLFVQFLEVSKAITESSEEMDAFLWFLDGGAWDGYSLDDLLQVLHSPKQFQIYLERPPKTGLESSIHGLTEFLNFCGELDALLSKAADVPLLQSAMWHYHSYWFDIIREDVGNAVNDIIDQFEKWLKADAHNTGAAGIGTAQNADTMPQTQQSLDDFRTLMTRLLDGRYSQELTRNLHRIQTEQD